MDLLVAVRIFTMTQVMLVVCFTVGVLVVCLASNCRRGQSLNLFDDYHCVRCQLFVGFDFRSVNDKTVLSSTNYILRMRVSSS